MPDSREAESSGRRTIRPGMAAVGSGTKIHGVIKVVMRERPPSIHHRGCSLPGVRGLEMGNCTTGTTSCDASLHPVSLRSGRDLPCCRRALGVTLSTASSLVLRGVAPLFSASDAGGQPEQGPTGTNFPTVPPGPDHAGRFLKSPSPSRASQSLLKLSRWRRSPVSKRFLSPGMSFHRDAPPTRQWPDEPVPLEEGQDAPRRGGFAGVMHLGGSSRQPACPFIICGRRGLHRGCTLGSGTIGWSWRARAERPDRPHPAALPRAGLRAAPSTKDAAPCASVKPGLGTLPHGWFNARIRSAMRE